MLFSNGTLSAFQTAAGIAPDKMSMLIRTVLLSLTFLWAAWCIYGRVTHFRYHDMEVFDVFQTIFRVGVIIVFVLGLVFIS